MMNTVRESFHSIGDRSGDLARSFGSGTVHLARRVGDGTVSLARDIGPRRALIGLAVAAVAIGGSVLILRYLRSRRAEAGFDLDETGGETARGSKRSRASGSDTRISY